MLPKSFLVTFGFVLILLNTNRSYGSSNLQEDIASKMENNNNKVILSRRRRFLQFPAGSSFQLVFCLTYPSLGVGSYFVFGHTAALAFELPSKPLRYDGKDFQEDEEPIETTTTEMPKDYPELEFTDFNHTSNERNDNSYSTWKLPYNTLDRELTSSNMPITPNMNPFMDFARIPAYSARRRTNYVNNNFSKGNFKYQQKPKYVDEDSQRHNNNSYSHMTLNLDPKFYSVQRRSRREVYQRIESFLTRLNLDGKACLLKAICETRQYSNEKQTFLEESFKAIFRAKPHDEFEDEDEYDAAYSTNNNCEEMFSECKGSIKNVQLLVRK